MSDISRLTSDLSAPDVEVRRAAAERLATLEADARPAAVPLVRCCGDADESVREWSAAALEQMGPPDAGDLAALTELLACAGAAKTTPEVDSQAQVQYWAATLIGRLGPAAAPAVAELGRLLGGPATIEVRQRAAWALGRLGPAAGRVRSALEAAARDPDPRLARLAADALR